MVRANRTLELSELVNSMGTFTHSFKKWVPLVNFAYIMYLSKTNVNVEFKKRICSIKYIQLEFLQFWRSNESRNGLPMSSQASFKTVGYIPKPEGKALSQKQHLTTSSN